MPYTDLTDREKLLLTLMGSPSSSRRAAPQAQASALGETAPKGWEFNPMWKSYGSLSAFADPVTNGQPRFITTDEYLRKFATADPNKADWTWGPDEQHVQFDPRAPDSPQRIRASAQPQFDQFNKLLLYRQLMERFKPTPLKPISIEGINPSVLDSISSRIKFG